MYSTSIDNDNDVFTENTLKSAEDFHTSEAELRIIMSA